MIADQLVGADPDHRAAGPVDRVDAKRRERDDELRERATLEHRFVEVWGSQVYVVKTAGPLRSLAPPDPIPRPATRTRPLWSQRRNNFSDFGAVVGDLSHT